ncbi:MAG TPA: CPBP family intramembrane glutamic endopeptidase [Chloroflexota bacterium]|nr:CPBP family intramembrane glutamic endopeptidase [Chloroflexota bacterium]
MSMFSSYGRRAIALGARAPLPVAATRRPPVPWKARDAFAILAAGLAFLLASLIVTLGLFELQSADAHDTNTKDLISTIVQLAFFLLLLWLMWMLIVKRYRCDWRMLGLRAAGWQWVAAVPLIFAFLLFADVVMFHGMVAIFGPAAHWPTVLTSTTIDSAQQPGLDVLSIGTGVILTPLAEELLFRGVLYQGLRRTMPMGAAALVSALVFAGMHFTLVLFIPFTVMGLVLAWLYERSGSLFPGMLVHACNNGIILVIIVGSQTAH